MLAESFARFRLCELDSFSGLYERVFTGLHTRGFIKVILVSVNEILARVGTFEPKRR